MRALTGKQLAFAKLLHDGVHRRDAYRTAFACRPDRPLKHVDEDARRLVRDPRVMAEMARLGALQGPPPAQVAPQVAVLDGAVVLPFLPVLDSPTRRPAQAVAQAEAPTAPAMPAMPLQQPLGLLPELVDKARHSKEWFMALLEVNVARALQLVPVLDSQGASCGEYVYAGGVANKALELMAKIEGVLIERRQVTVNTLAEMPIDEVRRRRVEVERQLLIERGELAEDVDCKETA